MERSENKDLGGRMKISENIKFGGGIEGSESNGDERKQTFQR